MHYQYREHKWDRGVAYTVMDFELFIGTIVGKRDFVNLDPCTSDLWTCNCTCTWNGFFRLYASMQFSAHISSSVEG